jgi:hypothetical protein
MSDDYDRMINQEVSILLRYVTVEKLKRQSLKGAAAENVCPPPETTQNRDDHRVREYYRIIARLSGSASQPSRRP